MVNTKITLSGVELKNPIIPASGTFGYGEEMAALYDLNILGGISVKGTTKEPRFGNPTPRIAEVNSGIINSVGLQNPGIEEVVQTELPNLRKLFNGAIIANISGFSVEEYVFLAEKLNAKNEVGVIEVNISCPNVHGGGMSFGTDKNMAALVTKSVRRATTKPLFIKLTPNVTNIAQIAKACEEEGADGISMINTISAMRVDIKKREPILKNCSGGLSGDAIFPIALKMIYDTYKAVKIPIMGMGGVSSAKDVVEMMLCGASAVQVGAYNLVNPFGSKEICENLPVVLEELNVKNINEIIGGAH